MSVLPWSDWPFLRALPVQPVLQVASSALGGSIDDAGSEKLRHSAEVAMSDDAKFVLWLLLLSTSSSCSELDVQCLKSIKQSVIDPRGVLKSSWIFYNGDEGYICSFHGVRCWYPEQNRILSLHLGNLGLPGPFPQGLQDCTTMTGLDLSSNNFSGPIPHDMSRQMPYLTSLDLSYNSFSGEIASNISNMRNLNSLSLQYNQLSGEIPEQFHLLTHLTMFNVADNLLSGNIPFSLQNFSASSFVGNQKLCGSPLVECFDSRWKRTGRISDESIMGAAVGFVAGFVAAFYFPHWFILSERLRAYVVRIWI